VGNYLSTCARPNDARDHHNNSELCGGVMLQVDGRLVSLDFLISPCSSQENVSDSSIHSRS
jgi:hypothetical protein